MSPGATEVLWCLLIPTWGRWGCWKLGLMVTSLKIHGDVHSGYTISLEKGRFAVKKWWAFLNGLISWGETWHWAGPLRFP